MRWALLTTIAVGLFVSRTGAAQSPAPAPPPVERAASEGPAAKPYEDRLIEGAAAGAADDAEREPEYQADGWPRSWRIEGFSSNLRRADGTTRENGVTVSGRIDSPDYGALSIDGAFRGHPASSLFTVWQRGMPFDNGWFANNGLGMLNTPALPLSRRQYRFFLPTFPVLGVASEWQHGRETQLFASVGEPGLFSGLRLAGFSRQGGTLLTAGAQSVLAPGIEWGLQVADARAVHSIQDPAEPRQSTSARSWFGSLAWQEGDTRLQLNLLDSATDDRRHRLGAWLDGESRIDRYRQNFGIFKLHPDLNWAFSPVGGDVQGGYYRLQYQSQRWIWSGGIDTVSSVSAATGNSWYGTGNVRYLWDRSTSVGGGLTSRHSNNDASAGFVFLDKVTGLGTTRTQLDVASTDAGDRSRQLTVDHAWPTEVGLRLSTSLSAGQETRSAAKTRRTSLALIGSADLTNRLSVDANVRWTRSDSGVATTGRYANLSLNWRLTSRWSLAMSYYDNRAEAQDLLTVASPIPVTALVPAPKDRAIFLIVRYEDQAGTPVVPLGGSRGVGAGSVVGVIFLDNNDNGLQDADETGAANVTVLLDGRFSTRTDSQGRFEFPMVAAGSHFVVVVPDNLPLPYVIGGDGRRAVEVRTREITRTGIAATRMK